MTCLTSLTWKKSTPPLFKRRFVNEKRVRTRVGGFDLVYNDASIKQEKTSNYASYLGSYNPVTRAPRIKKRFAASMNALLASINSISQ